MNYIEFQKKMHAFPVFSTGEIEKQFPRFNPRRLVEWQKKGYITRLRNRFYCFTDNTIDEYFLYFAANKFYKPSYVSLESALEYHGFIPEGVFSVTACTTLKNQRFKTPLATFVYSHLKKELFFGYTLVSWKDYRIAIAEPEKTLLDYLYLHPEIKHVEDIESLRWNPFSIREHTDPEKLTAYETHINSPSLSKRLSILKAYLHVETE